MTARPKSSHHSTAEWAVQPRRSRERAARDSGPRVALQVVAWCGAVLFRSFTSSAVEALARDMYGLEKAFEEAQCVEDWKQPKGNKAWTSKVRWGLCDRYSAKALLN